MSATLESQIATLQNAELRQALNDDLLATYRDIMSSNCSNLLPLPTAKPSPLPWELVDNDWEIWDADGQSIACTGNDSHTAWGRMVDAVNGQLIVKAVNAHADLVTALERAYIVMSNAAEHAIADTEEGHAIPQPYAQLDDELRFVRAALAKAQS